jgi:oligopeptide transport system ATP-binding protein
MGEKAMTRPLVEVQNLSKHFVLNRTWNGRPLTVVQAVEDVSFSILPGETLGLVGETGCGKSTVGRTLVGLYDPSSGHALLDGADIHAALRAPDHRLIRRRLQMIFQDPYASLDPRMTVGDIVGEPLDIHRLSTGNERQGKIDELLRQVGLDPEHAGRFPHEFSGGQRQRVGIARSLAAQPDVIVCDEPISALDVSIQAQVVNLMQDIQDKLGLTYLFIAHDLSMVRHISHRIAVMYLGSLVEIAASAELFHEPHHPYTQALLSAIPLPDPQLESERKRIFMPGEVPSPINPPSGCRFRTRCQYAMPICAEQKPALTDDGSGHQTACHIVHPL